MFKLQHLCLCASLLVPQALSAEDDLKVLEQFVSSETRPFVVVQASADDRVGSGQGVVISSNGLTLSVGHLSWIGDVKKYAEKFTVSFRGEGDGLPPGVVNINKTIFADKESAAFLEHTYRAEIQKHKDSRFLNGKDLSLFKIQHEGKGSFSKVDFYSDDKPAVKIGDTFYLCHYNSPTTKGNPIFLINPVEIVGMAQTTFGVQYLAKGFYRVGSSGGAILKDGKLIGIQSSGYTINAKDAGEIPVGLISFQLVWKNKFSEFLDKEE